MSILKIKNANNEWQSVTTLANETILDGYTMVTAPTFTDGKCILSDSDTYAVGSEGVGTSLSASDYVPVMGRNTLIIMFPVFVDTKPTDVGLAFYDKSKNALPLAGANVFWGRTGDEPRAKTAEVFVPWNAAYFRTTWWSSTVLANHPDIPAFTYTFTPGDWRDSAITHEMPTCRGMENAIRRTRQLTDIKWKPKVKVPRYSMMNGSSVHFTDWCEVGKEYTGIPYSGSGDGDNWNYNVLNPNCDAGKWGYYQFWVGLEVTPDTFITASRYPNSIFGTRANLVGPNYDSAIYGDVCTALLSYACGLTGHIWPVGQFMSATAYGKNYFWQVGTLNGSVTSDKLRLGDVFHNSGHVSIITDIIRDSTGAVSAVEISEATTIGNANNSVIGEEYGGFCRRKTWPVADLYSSYWATSYTLYRYKNFTSVTYTQSQYVDTGNELDCMPVIDYPCIPYLGNKARYKAGYIYNSKILIGATGFTTLVVTKDGEAFNSFTLNGATEISVGFSATGSYEAHLTGSGGIRSLSCYWTVE